MFDQVPLRVWLLIVIAAFAFAPVQYIFRHVASSPSGRDITKPSEDLSWRSSRLLARNIAILAALAGVSIFIFTRLAEQIAQSRSFWPGLVAIVGAWALYTVPRGFVTGQAQPFAKGFHQIYFRRAQPKRFWASLIWNGALACFLLWVAYEMNADALEQSVQDRCFEVVGQPSPQEKLAACNDLIGSKDDLQIPLANVLGARGDAYYDLGEYRLALADYDEAIRLDPRDSYSHHNRGRINYELGDPRRAHSDYSEAIRLRPEGFGAFLDRGQLNLNAGMPDEAVSDFSRAHALKPKDPWALANRGVAYAWKKETSSAEKDFREVRAIDPSNPVMLRGEALLRRNAGDFPGAVDRLTASLKRDPDNLWALRTRSELYWELGEIEKSRTDDQKWMQLKNRTRPKGE